VRTITERAAGTDRATKQRAAKLERITIDRNKTATERRQQRTRDAIPKRLAELDKARADLLREASLSAKQE
jgi:hypothetical protein